MSRQIGNEAEDRAADYLQGLGFALLARNYTIRGAEVDIIAQEGETVAFVEVKYRKDSRNGVPRESVTPAKQRRIGMAAAKWLQAQGRFDAPIRFDVVEVTPEGIELIRAAFNYME